MVERQPTGTHRTTTPDPSLVRRGIDFWSGIFQNDHPVEVEIGSGTGTFLVPAAAANQEINFLGIENARSRAKMVEEAVHQQGLRNVIVLAADGGCVVDQLIPAASVSAYHVYFPDPWWKRRHHRRRLFTPAFVAALARTLIPGGRLYVATDVDLVIELMLATIASVPQLRRDPALRSPRRSQTTFERKGLCRGAAIHDAVFINQPAAVGYPSNAAPMTPAESPN